MWNLKKGKKTGGIVFNFKIFFERSYLFSELLCTKRKVPNLRMYLQFFWFWFNFVDAHLVKLKKKIMIFGYSLLHRYPHEMVLECSVATPLSVVLRFLIISPQIIKNTKIGDTGASGPALDFPHPSFNTSTCGRFW